MKSNPLVEFLFRVWLYPEDGDPTEIEVWYHGLEEISETKRSISEWARESFSCEDFRHLFKIENTDKCWQIIGKATIRGWFDYWGEYDEEIDIIEYEKSLMFDEYAQWKIVKRLLTPVLPGDSE